MGFGFYRNTKIKRIVPSVHWKSKVSFINEVREVLSRNRKGSIEHIKKELKEKLVGWNVYFKWASYETWLKQTDQWIRRRIRQLLWKCWKKVLNFPKNLHSNTGTGDYFPKKVISS